MKRDTDDIVGIITAYVVVGIPVAFCALFALNMYLEYGDWFLSSMLFIISSIICMMIVNACSPLLVVIALTVWGLLTLTKKSFSGIRHLINRHTHRPA